MAISYSCYLLLRKMASKGLGESAATASRTQKVALISGITGQVSLLLKCCRVGS